MTRDKAGYHTREQNPAQEQLITVPIVLPRIVLGESAAANGTICCATVANTPISSEAQTSAHSAVASAAKTRVTLKMTNCVTINRRRSIRSPSGTSRRRPSAYPN